MKETIIRLSRGKSVMENKGTYLKERVSYGLGDVASNLIFVTVSSYLAYFYTDIFGISAAAVGTLFLIARAFDAINDPIAGIFIDRTNTKWGKSRPYFLWFAIPFAVFGILTFYTPDLSMTGKIVYAYITYNLLNVSFTFVNLPLNSLLPSLTADPQERTVLNSFRMVGGQVGAFIVNFSVLPLVSWLGQGNDQEGFLYTMTLLGAVGVAMFFTTFANTRERFQPQGNRPVPLKEGVKAIKGNLPWFIMLIIIFSYWVAYTAKIQTTIYYLQYNTERMELVPIINGMTILMIVSMVFVPYISSRINKRNTMIWGYVIAIIGQLLILVGGSSIIMLIIGNAVCFLGLGLVNGLIYAMVADTIDYGEWKSGVRAQGLLSASASFGFKFGQGVGGAIPIWIMSAAGYIANQEQGESSLLSIQFNFVWIPIIFFIIGLVSLVFYRLDNKTNQKIIEDLEGKRNESQPIQNLN